MPGWTNVDVAPEGTGAVAHEQVRDELEFAALGVVTPDGPFQEVGAAVDVPVGVGIVGSVGEGAVIDERGQVVDGGDGGLGVEKGRIPGVGRVAVPRFAEGYVGVDLAAARKEGGIDGIGAVIVAITAP